MSTDIRQYLLAETTNAQKSFTRGIILMVILVVALVAYFQWLKSQLGEILQEDALAELVTSEVRRNLPTAASALEKNLTTSMPHVVEYIIVGVVDESIPLVRQVVEELFRDYSRELAGFGVQASDQVFEELVKESKADLLKAKETAEEGFYTPNRVADNLTTLINQEMGTRINSRPEETMGTKLRESVTALNRINARLDELASTKRPSRKDELSKRLITTWWEFLNQAEPGMTAEERMLDTIKRPVTEGDDPASPGNQKEAGGDEK